MKKIFAIILTLCLMASAFCITSFAAEATDKLPEPAEGTLLRVTAIKGDETVLVGDYTNFEDGWHAAIKESTPRYSKWTGYERTIIDFYADWTSANDGNFTDDGALENNRLGFDNDTIEIPDDVKITINLNGHTIKRVLPESISDGEVIYIDEDADVIINNGTITGGKSTNGAGGIHIHDAHVMLNNVHIEGNVADGDDGGGIALYDDATLIMKGGSFKNNVIVGSSWNANFQCYGGAVYVNSSKASFEDVEFKNNNVENDENFGTAIYADDSDIVIKNCTFDGNGLEDDAKNFMTALSIIHGEDSTIQVEKSTFTNNCSGYVSANVGLKKFYSSIFIIEDGELYISDNCKFSNNNAHFLLFARQDAGIYVSDTSFTDNKAMVMRSVSANYDDNYFKNCTFNNNKMTSEQKTFVEYKGEAFDITINSTSDDVRLVFENCDLGDSVFKEIQFGHIKFVDCTNAPKIPNGIGSLFGEGSLTMVISLLAFIVSVAAFSVNISANKAKKVVAVKEKDAEEE